MAGERSAGSPEGSYDLVIVGAGPGGYVAALRAAQLGLKVAVVEKDRSPGGTCLNVGCIPSKALLESSEQYDRVRSRLGVHGIKVPSVELDLPAMMGRKDKIVSILTRGIAGLFRKSGVELVTGTARLAGPGMVEIDGGPRTLRASRILVATGSAPISLPELPFDGERIVTSTEALALPRVPERLLVVGAGAIGLELGSVWSRLGSQVTVAEFTDGILPGMDRQMTTALRQILEKQGLTFHLKTRATAARVSGGGVEVSLESDGRTESGEWDVVLVAVGRRPFSDGLGLRELGVKVDERGRIVVNQRYETNVAGVFAVGDVIAGPMLAHKAQEEGIAAVELMAGQAGLVNYDAIPGIVYTWPELASVGKSEEDARAGVGSVRVGTFPFMANGRARCAGETDGLVKVVVDDGTDRLLGVHVLGPHASELIAEAALAMQFEATAEDIAGSVHAHPTLAEALKEAALAAGGRALHV